MFKSGPPVAKSIDEIKVAVNKAIENKDPREIDSIKEQRDLRIAQRYLDQLISNEGLDISFESELLGKRSFVFALVAIGIAYFLVGAAPYVSKDLVAALDFIIIGIAPILFSLIIWGLVESRANKKIDKIMNKIKDMQKLVLIIEERLEK